MQDAVFVAPPPGTVWPLTVGEFQHRILGRRPEALCTVRHEPIRGQDYLAFEVDLEGSKVSADTAATSTAAT